MQRDGVDVGGLVGVHFKRMVLIVGVLVGVFAQGKRYPPKTPYQHQTENFPSRETAISKLGS